MIKAVNTIRVRKGFAEHVIERFRELKGIKQAPGFIGLEIWKLEDVQENDEVKVCSTWETQEDFDTWTNSDAFKDRHKHVKNDNGSEKPKTGPVMGAELTIYSVPIVHELEKKI